MDFSKISLECFKTISFFLDHEDQVNLSKTCKSLLEKTGLCFFQYLTKKNSEVERAGIQTKIDFQASILNGGMEYYPINKIYSVFIREIKKSAVEALPEFDSEMQAALLIEKIRHEYNKTTFDETLQLEIYKKYKIHIESNFISHRFNYNQHVLKELWKENIGQITTLEILFPVYLKKCGLSVFNIIIKRFWLKGSIKADQKGYDKIAYLFCSFIKSFLNDKEFLSRESKSLLSLVKSQKDNLNQVKMERLEKLNFFLLFNDVVKGLCVKEAFSDAILLRHILVEILKSHETRGRIEDQKRSAAAIDELDIIFFEHAQKMLSLDKIEIQNEANDFMKIDPSIIKYGMILIKTKDVKNFAKNAIKYSRQNYLSHFEEAIKDKKLLFSISEEIILQLSVCSKPL